MKRYLFTLVTALTLVITPISLTTLVWPAAGIALVASVTGCKTANTAAYKVTGTAVVTVDTAMKAWGDYVRDNHPSVEQEQRVKDAYEKYQAAALAVTTAGAAHARVLAAQGDATGPLTTLNAAIAIASASLSDLIAAIQRFGIKLNNY